ncbi:heavy metal-associated domain-containing protein [uncultured Microbacterium sp.]|uniref:heavy-metal-associated domain-containing protein n=1 Tax=uncultured Microbacterium sp. TaxID=191216 RepID=UPI00261C585E|nr:heavy metal-associated domain-containing protein [uncultured Microbacterium sp.]
MEKALETIVLQVEGMTCTGCEQRLRNALRRVDGVSDANADHVSGRVEVGLRGGGTDWSVLAETITRAGYQVVGAEPEAAAGGGLR